MNHEKDTLKEIVEARNTYNSATTHEDAVNADTELTKSVSKLFALAEAYPELKANENFNSLQAELSETEDKISAARLFYSDTVLKYNNKIQMFPSSIVAGIFGFREEKFFEATAVERENVKVSFDK
jgi:LemA protein